MSEDFRRPKLVLLAVLAAALFAAGCGGDDKSDYRDKVNDANDTFEKELDEAGAKMRAAGQSKNRQQYSDGARQLQAAVTAFTKELEELEEPDGAKEEEEALIAALGKFSGTVGRINAAVQADDEDAIRTEIATLQPQAQQVESAGDALEKAVE